MPRHPRKTLFNRLSGSRMLAPLAAVGRAFYRIGIAPTQKDYRAFREEYTKLRGEGGYRVTSFIYSNMSMAIDGSASAMGALCRLILPPIAVVFFAGLAAGTSGVTVAVALSAAVAMAATSVSVHFLPAARLAWAAVAAVPAALIGTRHDRQSRIERRAAHRLEKQTRFEVKKLPTRQLAPPPAAVRAVAQNRPAPPRRDSGR